jgi:peptidyl-prolyl cis-trans isomerase D
MVAAPGRDGPSGRSSSEITITVRTSMLQLIRSKAGSFVVKVLFVLLIGSFGLWGVGDFLRQAPRDATVITVGSESFQGDRLQKEFQKSFERMRQMVGGNLDIDQARAFGLAERTVDTMVANALFDQEANRLHVVIGDPQIAHEIAAIPGLKMPDGSVNRVAFLSGLAQARLTEAQYVAMTRDDLRRQTVDSVATATPNAPKVLVDLLYGIRDEHRVADYVFLATSAVKDLPAPDDSALHTYYDQHRDVFTAPEYRGFTALVLQNADVAASVTIDEEKLKAAYAERVGDADHPGEFVKPETRHVLQMLLPDEATAATAEQALAAGTDFAEVAKTIAKQDASTVDLGSVAKGDLPAEIAGAAFDAKLDEVTQPLHSALGWHVLKITGIVPGSVKSFDEAKADLEREQRADAERDALDKLSTEVENALAGGAELAAVAQQFNLKPITVAAVDATGRDPAGTPLASLPIAAAPVIKTVFDTAEGQVGNLEDVDDGAAYYVVKVDSVTAPALRPFEAVKDQVVAGWTADQRTAKVTAEAKELAEAVKPDMTLAQLAAARKLELKTTEPFTRSNERHLALLPSDAIAGLFKADLGGVATGTASDGEFVAQLKDIRPAGADAAATAQLKKQLDQELGSEMLEEFQLALRDRYAVDINQAAIDRLLGGGAGQ